MNNAAKETNEIIDLVVESIKTIKAKGDYMALLPKLVSAIEGIGQVDDEIKNQKEFLNAVGGRLGDLIDAITSK